MDPRVERRCGLRNIGYAHPWGMQHGQIEAVFCGVSSKIVLYRHTGRITRASSNRVRAVFDLFKHWSKGPTVGQSLWRHGAQRSPCGCAPIGLSIISFDPSSFVTPDHTVNGLRIEDPWSLRDCCKGRLIVRRSEWGGHQNVLVVNRVRGEGRLLNWEMSNGMLAYSSL